MLKLPYKFNIDDVLKENRTSKDNIEFIKDWLCKTKHNSIPNIQDELIVIFLLSCDNDLELTKHTIEVHFICKKQCTQLFSERDITRDDLKKALRTVRISSLQRRTNENYAIHFFKTHDCNYLNFDLIPIMKLSYMLLDVTQEENLPNGLIVVIDMKGIGLMHLSRMKYGIMKHYFQYLQEGLPLQLKTIHVLNANYFFDKIMNIVRVFLKTHLIDMIKVHPSGMSKENLFSYVPKQCLPEEYGGDLPSVEVLHERTIKQFVEKQNFWDIEEKMLQIMTDK
ncbi:hypothetical protein GWI33_006007 [Rhynchophorus ferrugineus]|uniref:CRAL-TRIO domain-containing protein n=1 Tax=Rhynchophorus ferrugineus TaxID=354439 RepID=A0A834IYB8_RHYFE|nr:hypothetical protein GWI33_006007 [Rhynchophorus ferrugineus]